LKTDWPGVDRWAGLVLFGSMRGWNWLLKKAYSHVIKAFPQGLKPNICFVAFTARLKSCPDTKLAGF
jgi:hypothetical protein